LYVLFWGFLLPLGDDNASISLRAPSRLFYGQSKLSAVGVSLARSLYLADESVPHQNPWHLYVSMWEGLPLGDGNPSPTYELPLN